MAVKIQNDNIKMLTDNELKQKQLRLEWSKLLQSSYDEDIEDHKRRNFLEHEAVISGPTSIPALGSYYEQQMSR